MIKSLTFNEFTLCIHSNNIDIEYTYMVYIIYLILESLILFVNHILLSNILINNIYIYIYIYPSLH